MLFCLFSSCYSLALSAATCYSNYPCLCLCFGLMQITRKILLRLIILQLLQILLTEALTFMITPDIKLFAPECYAAPCKVIRRKLDLDLVARKDPYEIHPDLSRNMRQDLVAILQLYSEHSIR